MKTYEETIMALAEQYEWMRRPENVESVNQFVEAEVTGGIEMTAYIYGKSKPDIRRDIRMALKETAKRRDVIAKDFDMATYWAEVEYERMD